MSKAAQAQVCGVPFALWTLYSLTGFSKLVRVHNTRSSWAQHRFQETSFCMHNWQKDLILAVSVLSSLDLWSTNHIPAKHRLCSTGMSCPSKWAWWSENSYPGILFSTTVCGFEFQRRIDLVQRSKLWKKDVVWHIRLQNMLALSRIAWAKAMLWCTLPSDGITSGAMACSILLRISKTEVPMCFILLRFWTSSSFDLASHVTLTKTRTGISIRIIIIMLIVIGTVLHSLELILRLRRARLLAFASSTQGVGMFRCTGLYNNSGSKMLVESQDCYLVEKQKDWTNFVWDLSAPKSRSHDSVDAYSSTWGAHKIK